MALLYLRSSLFNIVYYSSGMVYGTLLIFVWVFPPLLRHRIIVLWTAFNVWWLSICCGIRYRILGQENLDNIPKPFVMLSKHQSAWETIRFQNLFFPASTILKKELLKIPFFGWGLRGLNPIGIDRSNPKEALKQIKTQGLQRLSQGFNLILFPEGTRVPAGEKGRYARGGADIASDARVPILPVAHNAGKCWPSGFLKYPGTITVSLGKPIFCDGKTKKEIIEEVERWIEGEMEKLD